MSERRNARNMPARREAGGQMDPWTRFSHEIDRMFDEFWYPSFFRRGRAARMWSPQVDVMEHSGELVVKADLPGIRREDLAVEVTEGMLTLRGERRQDEEREEEGFYRVERSYGSFLRTIPIPPGVDPEQVKASFRNGVLEIRMPMQKEMERARQIEIQEGSEGEHAGTAAGFAPRAETQTAAQGATSGSTGTRGRETTEGSAGRASRPGSGPGRQGGGSRSTKGEDNPKE
jgi:HSP20 family protein